MSLDAVPDADLLAAAEQVLRDNDIGHMVTAAPRLYPHQWSWDAAFVAVGLAHASVRRALREMQTILDGQWSTGMLPHIVFSDNPDYFPGFEAWGTEPVPARPPGVKTSGICQPPVHALCLERIVAIADAAGTDAELVDAFVRDAVPRLARWHDWLQTARDPAGLGLIEIHHGWESGMDNSPRFDAIYHRIEVPERIEMLRTDLKYADAADRPSDQEYQRYIHLINQMRSVNFDDALLPGVIDFRFGDVFMTAILHLSAHSLARLAGRIGDRETAAGERNRADNCRLTVLGTVNDAGLCRDYDIAANRWLEIESMASFSLLLCGGEADAVARQRAILVGQRWMAHPENLHRVVPSVSLDDPDVKPREYWRGPQWPIMNWLFAHAALERGDGDLAALLRSEGLNQLRDLQFGEYYEPRTGEPLGSKQQSWSAMAAIDWLRSDRWR
jgi:hypothetical protein